MNRNGVEAFTEGGYYKGTRLITGDGHTEDRNTDTPPVLTANSLKMVRHDLLLDMCAVYMRLNESSDRLLRIYREQLGKNDVYARYPSLICIIREQEETINDLRRELQYIISSVLSDSCLNCVLKFVKSGKV